MYVIIAPLQIKEGCEEQFVARISKTPVEPFIVNQAA